MAHKEYTIKQGECIESIAYEHGLFWETIWDDPKNAELKRTRQNPNCLLPGDRVYIRDKEEKEVTAPSEQRHRFRRKGVPAVLRMVFLRDGEPQANVPYTIEIDGRLDKGITNEEGLVEHSLPPNAEQGKLILGEGNDREEYELDLRHLDPVGTVSGVQARLNNLGYDVGPVDGQMNSQTSAALSSFQSDHDLENTGKLNQATIDKLEEVHGG